MKFNRLKILLIMVILIGSVTAILIFVTALHTTSTENVNWLLFACAVIVGLFIMMPIIELSDLRKKKVKKIFKINDLVDMRLVGKKTRIFVNNEMLLVCSHLFLNIPKERIWKANEIKSMDEAARVFKSTKKIQHKISSKQEFIGHCSNIQAFFENGLSTDILITDVAFPLLKELVDNGYEPAIRVFKEEIVKRYNTGTTSSRMFLSMQGYLFYLNEEEIQELKRFDPDVKHLSIIEMIRESALVKARRSVQDKKEIFEDNDII